MVSWELMLLNTYLFCCGLFCCLTTHIINQKIIAFLLNPRTPFHSSWLQVHKFYISLIYFFIYISVILFIVVSFRLFYIYFCFLLDLFFLYSSLITNQHQIKLQYSVKSHEMVEPLNTL